jgi:hypothetical protein
MPKHDYSTWLTKQEIAAAIGVTWSYTELLMPVKPAPDLPREERLKRFHDLRRQSQALHTQQQRHVHQGEHRGVGSDSEPKTDASPAK